MENFVETGRLEGRVAREAGVEDMAERVEIGAGVERHGLELFRGGVVDGAHDTVGSVHGLGGGRVLELGEAEVEDFEVDPAIGQGPDHEVGGLEIAVKDAALVSGVDAFESLAGDFDEGIGIEDALLKTGVEGFAFDELHDVKSTVGVLAEVEEGDDVGVLEGGEGFGFFPGGFGGLTHIGDVFAETFDGDTPFELFVPTEIDVSEAAGGDALDLSITSVDEDLLGRISHSHRRKVTAKCGEQVSKMRNPRLGVVTFRSRLPRGAGFEPVFQVFHGQFVEAVNNAIGVAKFFGRVGGGDGDPFCAGGLGGFEADEGVFEDDGAGGGETKALGGEEEDFGIGFATGDVFGGNFCREKMGETELVEGDVDIEAVGG